MLGTTKMTCVSSDEGFKYQQEVKEDTFTYVPKFPLYSSRGTQSCSTLCKCPRRHKLYDDATSTTRERESFMSCQWAKLRPNSACTATTLNPSLPCCNYNDASAISNSDHHHSRHPHLTLYAIHHAKIRNCSA